MTLCGATRLFGAVAILAFSALFAQAAPFMIIGNDEKFIYDEAGKVVLSPAGKDSVSIVDLANPENPKIVANLALKNSVLGPPMNLDIDPTGSRTPSSTCRPVSGHLTLQWRRAARSL